MQKNNIKIKKRILILDYFPDTVSDRKGLTSYIESQVTFRTESRRREKKGSRKRAAVHSQPIDQP